MSTHVAAPAAGAARQAPPPAPRSRLAELLARHHEAVLTALCALFTLAGWGLEAAGEPAAAFTVYAVGMAAGGALPARDALVLLWRERELDVDLLMVLAALGAASIGHWVEGGVLIFIFSLSGTLETYAMARTRREITALMSLKPAIATVRRNGHEEVVSAADLQVGDMVIIRPGERIPADGVVLEGNSAVDQSAITGESVPKEKEPGQEVFAGTINGHGALLVRTERPAEETVIARIVRMVQDAREQTPPSQLFIERFERLYSRAIVLATALLWLVPPLFLQQDWSSSLYRAMVFLVAASPCALTMSIMPALLSAIATAARQGILLKGARHLETLGAARVVAFDKTGTLTRGQPTVTEVQSLDPAFTGEDILRSAAAVESRSEHPLAEAIVRAAWGLELPEPADVQATPGQNVSALVDGRRIVVGRPESFPGGLPPELAPLRDEGKTVVLVAEAGRRPFGAIALRDQLRPGAAAAVAAIRALGLRTVMLTGDDPRTARALAGEAGVDEYHAGLLPQQKVDLVRRLHDQYGRVAMVGDGVNDAPALAAAAVGIAMGRKGTDVALEAADMVLMGDDLDRLPYGISLGRRAGGIVRQNIAFACLMILALISGTFLGGLQLPLGVLGHEGSTLLVTLNGLRMLRG